MSKIEKIIWSQDAFFKTKPCKSGETSINMSNEIFVFLGSVEDGYISFKIYKEDYLKALCSLSLLLPLYTSSSKKATLKEYSNKFFDDYYQLIINKFGDSDSADYKVHSLKREEGRFYLNDLKENETGFNIRYFFVQSHSVVTFVQKDDGTYELRFRNSVTELSKDQISDTEEEETLEIPDTFRPLQQIFYGAPGTGKSHTIKEKTKGLSVVRTTFHPDSDYSTFVGAYKPTMVEGTCYGLNGSNTVALTYPDGSLAGKPIKDKKIIYRFVIQAFTKAYLMAWKKLSENADSPQPQFLVIEEINRGNCAQIFGDLFQLLDRGDNGYSAYYIEADADMQQAIEQAFNDDEIDGKENKLYKLATNLDVDDVLDDYTSNYDATLSEDIQSGRVLLLPKNLYIWATMNTSDQSLFPIDSAFKRRWDWTYIPIKQHDEGYRVKIDTVTYDWWGFLEKINQVIGTTTSSEDKKLGYFFVKAENKEIGADKFVSKVLFYLWNDVFKNHGFDNPIFSRGENNTFDFSDFFKKDGTPETSMVNLFLRKLDETIDKDNSFENKPTAEAEAEPDQPAENEE